MLKIIKFGEGQDGITASTTQTKIIIETDITTDMVAAAVIIEVTTEAMVVTTEAMDIANA